MWGQRPRYHVWAEVSGLQLARGASRLPSLIRAAAAPQLATAFWHKMWHVRRDSGEPRVLHDESTYLVNDCWRKSAAAAPKA